MIQPPPRISAILSIAVSRIISNPFTTILSAPRLLWFTLCSLPCWCSIHSSSCCPSHCYCLNSLTRFWSRLAATLASPCFVLMILISNFFWLPSILSAHTFFCIPRQWGDRMSSTELCYAYNKCRHFCFGRVPSWVWLGLWVLP